MISVSIIIPTYNRLDRLKMVLGGLEGQTYPLTNFEVIVVSDGATDGTNDFLSTIETPLNIKPIFEQNRGVAAARNHGLKEARGDIILFIDDDVLPTPQLITEHMRMYDEYGNDIVVIGPMITPPDFNLKPWVKWEQDKLYDQYQAMISGHWAPTGRQFYTGNTSLAHSYLIKTKGFDPAFRRAEDVELAYRLSDLGIKFIYNHCAIGYHYAERSFQSWKEIANIYGRSDVIFTYEKGQSWLLPVVCREFLTRNALIQALIRLCLDKSILSYTIIILMERAMLIAYRLGMSSLSNMACSAIFNLKYYQGIADELGNRDAFFALVEQEKTRLSI